MQLVWGDGRGFGGGGWVGGGEDGLDCVRDG